MAPAPDHARLAKKFKALAHPNRLQLFAEILEAQKGYEAGHECFLQTIMQSLKVAAPTVSHHIKELVNAELITTRLEGKLLTCTVNPDALGELEAFFVGTKAKARRR
jgi:ArsR family transcriptional regulator, arsenate/arsenite/antimonite-responsive transcriptional repressor